MSMPVVSHKIMDEYTFAAITKLPPAIKHRAGHNTVVWWDWEDNNGPATRTAHVQLHGTVLADLSRHSVKVRTGGYNTATTTNRLQRILWPIGYRARLGASKILVEAADGTGSPIPIPDDGMTLIVRPRV